MTQIVLLAGCNEERVSLRPHLSAPHDEFVVLEVSPDSIDLPACLAQNPDVVVACPSASIAEIRRQNPHVPVLAAAIDLETGEAPVLRLRAIREGAADRAGGESLRTRVLAILSRAAHKQPLVAGGITIDRRRKRVVTSGGSPVRLTAKEFAILERLMEDAGSVVSRKDLLRGFASGVVGPQSGRALEVHISVLRRKLSIDCDQIRSVRGRGYMFAGESTRPAPGGQHS